MAFNWTTANVEKLKTMWTKGMSSRQIGEEMGGISRNSVIGKAHRLGLSAQKEKEPSKTTKSTKATQVRGAEKLNREPIHIAPHSNKSSDHLCQWPSGDPGTPDFKFCYAPAESGHPYCQEHCTLAYRVSK